MLSKGKGTEATAEAEPRRQMIILVAIVWIAIFAFHAQKALGFFPLVIPDEYTYSMSARHYSFSEASIPNYLYYAIFRLTNLFDERFLDAARILNAILFMSSAPFVFLIAKRICGQKLALIVTALILLGPASSFTAYFMPESLYFTLFWFFAWLELRRSEIEPHIHGLAAGAAIAVMTLVKMHGIFLLPGFALYVIVSETIWGAKNFRLKRILVTGLFAAVSFAVVRFGIGYLFAGDQAFHLLGKQYENLYTESRAIGSVGRLVYYSGIHFLANAAGICLIFAVPIAAMARIASGASLGKLQKILIFALTFLIPLLLVTSVFSSVAQLTYPEEMTKFYLRLQTRYFSFLFPFFPLIVAGTLAVAPGWPRGGHWKIPLIVFVLSCFTFLYHRLGFEVATIPEAPEIGGIYYSSHFFFFLAALSLGSLALFFFKPYSGCRMYLFVFFPLYTLISLASIQYQMIYGFGLFPELHDKAGIFARDYLGRETADLTVVDSFYETPKKTLLHIDDPRVDILAQFTPTVDMSQVKPGKKWLLVLGGLEVPKQAQKYAITYIDPAQDEGMTDFMRRMNDFRLLMRYQLIRIAEFDYSVDFSRSDHEWPIDEVRFEKDGVFVSYRIPLPRRISLVFNGLGEIDAQAKQGITVRAGDGAPQTIPLNTVGKIISDGKATTIFISYQDRIGSLKGMRVVAKP